VPNISKARHENDDGSLKSLHISSMVIRQRRHGDKSYLTNGAGRNFEGKSALYEPLRRQFQPKASGT
jgi:hypothetical protein